MLERGMRAPGGDRAQPGQASSRKLSEMLHSTCPGEGRGAGLPCLAEGHTCGLWGWMEVLPLTGCVFLGKLLNLSVPLLSHLRLGDQVEGLYLVQQSCPRMSHDFPPHPSSPPA